MSAPERVRLASGEHPRFRDGALPWFYYWLDLFGPHGSPANSKVLVSWGFAAALMAELWWGFQLTQPRCWTNAEGVRSCFAPTGVTWPYVVLVLATLAAAMGKDVFKAALKLRSQEED